MFVDLFAISFKFEPKNSVRSETSVTFVVIPRYEKHMLVLVYIFFVDESIVLYAGYTVHPVFAREGPDVRGDIPRLEPGAHKADSMGNIFFRYFNCLFYATLSPHESRFCKTIDGLA